MSEWKSVKDELPKKNQKVIAWFEGLSDHSGSAWPREGCDFAVFWGAEEKRTDNLGFSLGFKEIAEKNLDADSLEITHWMPAPEKPKD